MRPQFDEVARPQRFTDPERKGGMLYPARWTKVVGHPERGGREGRSEIARVIVAGHGASPCIIL